MFADLSVLQGCLQVESWIRLAELPSGQGILSFQKSIAGLF